MTYKKYDMIWLMIDMINLMTLMTTTWGLEIQMATSDEYGGGAPPQGQKKIEPQHPGFPRGPPPWY